MARPQPGAGAPVDALPALALPPTTELRHRKVAISVDRILDNKLIVPATLNRDDHREAASCQLKKNGGEGIELRRRAGLALVGGDQRC